MTDQPATIRFTLPGKMHLAVESPEEAARLLVGAYGTRAFEHEIAAKRSLFNATWDEVSILLCRLTLR